MEIPVCQSLKKEKKKKKFVTQTLKYFCSTWKFCFYVTFSKHLKHMQLKIKVRFQIKHSVLSFKIM